MRFHPNGPSIPDILLDRCDSGRVVFLCGAGVSVPSGMPDFVKLTRHVIEFFDPPPDSDIMTAFRPWLDDKSDKSAAKIPLDQIFNLLHLEYGKDEVNACVTKRLSEQLTSNDCGREHNLIKRISSSQNGVPQVVTTNFDRLFEAGPKIEGLVCYEPPAFPDINFGSTIEGITYLHGRLVDVDAESHASYVLSSADFGRAYLSEGWATNFIRHLLERYTVVLVGYKAEDPPIKYLLQGLNHDGLYDRSRLYAFDRGRPEEIEAKWRDRGVTAIAYSDHLDLWECLEAWAERAVDPRKWRASVIAKTQQDPKTLTAHERGQVAHILRTVQGARVFSESEPIPHPEWVCVMDANVRSAKQSHIFGKGAEVFDPAAVYGLDDDLDEISEDELRPGTSNDNLLVWRHGDDNPHDSHRLGGRQVEGYEEIPKRLVHLISWVSKSIHSPVIAWWAIRQNGLHPRLLHEIEWHLEHGKGFHGSARHTWLLILEHHRDSRNRQRGDAWFYLKSRIDAEGWTASTLREFRRVTTPRIDIRPPLGEEEVKPPSSAWEEVRLSALGQFELKFFKWHNEDLEVPDEMLLKVFVILQEQLTIASCLLADIEQVYVQTPTCYPNRDIDGTERFTENVKAITWIVQLFDRIAAKWPKLANAYATTWPVAAPSLFRKLKLYAFNKVDVFPAAHIAEELIDLDQEIFWDISVVRELLFLLEDRWGDISPEGRDQLIGRILNGPDQPSHCSDDDFPRFRNEFAARYARYLELRGCELTAVHSERLAEMIKNIPGWSDGWASSIVIEHGSHVGWVGRDETPDAILNLPDNEVVARAKEDQKRNFGSFIEKHSFTGLVKSNPRKALSGLTIAGKAGDYPEAFWADMIAELPADISPRLRRVFLNRVARLPHEVIVKLRHALSRWLMQHLVKVLAFDEDLGWAVYDHIVDGILSGGVDATKSVLGEVHRGGKVIQRSRRTLGHALSGPLGMCADSLFQAISGEKQEANSQVPEHIKSRLEHLFAVPGEGADHVVSITMRNLGQIMLIDPSWTEERLIPLLAFEHPAAEPAWNGFLHSYRQLPCQPLAAKIKPLLLNLFPWIEGFSWERDLLNVAAQWLGWLRMLYPDDVRSGLSQGEMRSVLRAMSDETRSQFIYWLGLVGQKNENGWEKYVIPLITDNWPRERRYRTSASVKAWIGLLDDTGDCFPDVYEAVKKLLVPLETDNHLFYHFTRTVGDVRPLTVQFPETTLDLMSKVTPQTLSRTPYELPIVLTLIAETMPELALDARYLRLIDLVERS